MIWFWSVLGVVSFVTGLGASLRVVWQLIGTTGPGDRASGEIAPRPAGPAEPRHAKPSSQPPAALFGPAGPQQPWSWNDVIVAAPQLAPVFFSQV